MLSKEREGSPIASLKERLKDELWPEVGDVCIYDLQDKIRGLLLITRKPKVDNLRYHDDKWRSYDVRFALELPPQSKGIQVIPTPRTGQYREFVDSGLHETGLRHVFWVGRNTGGAYLEYYTVLYTLNGVSHGITVEDVFKVSNPTPKVREVSFNIEREGLYAFASGVPLANVVDVMKSTLVEST